MTVSTKDKQERALKTLRTIVEMKTRSNLSSDFMRGALREIIDDVRFDRKNWSQVQELIQGNYE